MYSARCYKNLPGITPIIIIVAVGIIGLIIILTVTGVLKFRGNIGSTKTNETVQEEETSQTLQGGDLKSQSSPSPIKANLSETYTNQSLGFSIKYPQGWQADDSGTTVNIFIKEEGATSAENSIAGVIITTTPLGELKGSQLSTIADLWSLQIPKQFPGATITKKEQIKLGGQEAYLYVFSFTDKGKEFPSNFYLLIDKENLYGLIATTELQHQTKYEETLKSIAESFKLL